MSFIRSTHRISLLLSCTEWLGPAVGFVLDALARLLPNKFVLCSGALLKVALIGFLLVGAPYRLAIDVTPLFVASISQNMREVARLLLHQSADGIRQELVSTPSFVVRYHLLVSLVSVLAAKRSVARIVG